MARDGLLSAALRHVRDAEHLLSPGPNRSVEQALHLAGFGPECARKACLDEQMADHALGHDVRGATDTVVEVLLALDPAASRYAVDQHEALLPFRAAHWKPDCRYDPTRAPEASVHRVEDVVREARSFVDGCVLELWSDGVVSEDALRFPGG